MSDPTPRLRKNENDLREKQLFKFITEKAQKVEFSGSDVKPLKLERVDGNWKVNDKPGDNLFVETVIRKLSQLQADNFPKADATAEFDSPRLQAVVTLNSEQGASETKILLVGKETKIGKDKGYFARVGDKGEVFVIKESSYKEISPREETLIKIENPPPVSGSGTGEPASTTEDDS